MFLCAYLGWVHCKGANRRRCWQLRCKLGREPACPKTAVRPFLNPRARCTRTLSTPSQLEREIKSKHPKSLTVRPKPCWITRNYTTQRCDGMTISQVSLTVVSLWLYRTYILSPYRGFHWVSRNEGPSPSLPSCNLALYIIS